jgi:hypothetical protein
VSFEAERAQIVTHFNTQWLASPFASTPIIWENTNIKPPAGTYLMHRITDADGRQAEIAGDGPVLTRYVGIVQLDIMTAPGDGSAEARKMADTVSNIYRRKHLIDSAGGSITFRIPAFRAMGLTSERYRFVVTCPYIRDIRQ